MEQSGLSVGALSLADFFSAWGSIYSSVNVCMCACVCVLQVTLCTPVYVYAPTSVHVSERMRLASQTCQQRERE